MPKETVATLNPNQQWKGKEIVIETVIAIKSGNINQIIMTGIKMNELKEMTLVQDLFFLLL